MRVDITVDEMQILIDGFRSKPYDWDKAEALVQRLEAQIAELRRVAQEYQDNPWCLWCSKPIQLVDDTWIHSRPDGKIVDPASSKWCDGHSHQRATRNTNYDK